MEEFDRQHPYVLAFTLAIPDSHYLLYRPDTQNMNQPPQAGHWSNWQGPDPARQPTQQTTTYAHSPAPAPSQSIPNAWSPPPATPHGALNSNPYGVPPANPNVDTNAASLPASSGRWNYQPEAAAAPPPPQASAAGTGTGAPEEPRKSIDTSRLGLLPKRPVSLMDVNANTRPAAAPAPAPAHTMERDSDEESLEYVDRPMPGAMGRPS
ncbi:hypothetical protein FRC12_004101 [Ceratobasidium sp. 428]|nr:hypothetical protein FRC12_004101 [Ceratobasidium sp. 428]